MRFTCAVENASWRVRKKLLKHGVHACERRSRLQVLGGVASQLEHLGGEVPFGGARASAETTWDRRATLKSERLPATHSRMAALYTAAVAPTRPPEAARVCGGRRRERRFQIRGANARAREAARHAAAARAAVRAREAAAAARGRVARLAARLKEAVDAAHGELQAGLGGAGHGLLLVARRAADDALSSLAGAQTCEENTRAAHTRATRALPDSPLAPLPDMLK